MQEIVLKYSYLIACVLFIIGLKLLSKPDTARKGNLWGAAGMGIAIIMTILLYERNGVKIGNHIWIIGGLLVGTIAGWLSAKKVAMTAMPQMVSFFNGMGGACAAVIALIEFGGTVGTGDHIALLTVMGSLVVGSLTFSGSMIAFLKLNGNLKKDIRLPFYNILNTLMLLLIVGLTICLFLGHIQNVYLWFYILGALAFIYGILFVIPIGGADMPVVISLLNSFSGISGCLAGLIYGNDVMIVGGILVGAAGTILTVVMCVAMNRSLTNVIFGAFGTGGAAVKGSDSGDKTYRSINVSDSAILMNYSSSVVIVPGYGLAVAQAQHAVHELESILESRGVSVKYAIHPVAGRMPGHMNVLLAEANVDYNKLVGMDDINPELPNTDVVLILGANDVVNPVAKTEPGSPIYGMPIINAEDAKQCIIVKRSMNVGYAGIDNDLFYKSKSSMLFGDAKKILTELVAELKTM